MINLFLEKPYMEIPKHHLNATFLILCLQQGLFLYKCDMFYLILFKTKDAGVYVVSPHSKMSFVAFSAFCNTLTVILLF